MTRALILGLAMAAMLLGGIWIGRQSTPSASAPAVAAASVWTCSMHPEVQLPDPGLCPICNMDLIPLDASADSGSPRSIAFSEDQIAMADVRTAVVTRRPLMREVLLVGRFIADAGTEREVAARVRARVERRHVDAPGTPVARGEALFTISGADIQSAQAAVLSGTSLAAAARTRLREWGMTERQLDRLSAATGEIVLTAPAAGVVTELGAAEGREVMPGATLVRLADYRSLWVELEADEEVAGALGAGMTAAVTSRAHPDQPIDGVLDFVDPVVSPCTRAVSVRATVANPDGAFRPGMFARASVEVPVGGEDALVIPLSAPLMTGRRAVVYVADPSSPGRFEGREVVLGARGDDGVVVEQGLRDGERVVVNGAFKVDAAMQILARPSAMSMGAETGAGAQTAMGDVLVALAAVSDALAADDPSAGHAAAAHLVHTIEDASTATDVAGWARAFADLSAAAEAVAAAADLPTARTALDPLSTQVIAAAERFGVELDTPLVVVHCPMVYEDSGADWIQNAGPVANPYFGASMLRCGAEVHRWEAQP